MSTQCRSRMLRIKDVWHLHQNIHTKTLEQPCTRCLDITPIPSNLNIGNNQSHPPWRRQEKDYFSPSNSGYFQTKPVDPNGKKNDGRRMTSSTIQRYYFQSTFVIIIGLYGITDHRTQLKSSVFNCGSYGASAAHDAVMDLINDHKAFLSHLEKAG
ncbi:hypothetical protein HZH68_013616 [Vespula germanica]|uniref:Uncharacterized protein n=1 Tax=Vespula germanica TaxID=30212 RepID=A0A834JDN1_VESGE|nr:hypothetical protein HZH68_013616 [Vespula germanica]